MATILQVNSSVARGSEVLTAISQIQAGIATLTRLEGLLGEAIAVSPTEVESLFGLKTGDGQAFNDRWVALLTLINNDATGAKDFLNAVTQQYS